MPRQQTASNQTPAWRDKSRGFAECRGFALIGFLVAMPVMLAFVCVVAAAALLLKADTEKSFACDSNSYQIEADLAASMNKLLALNPRARSLMRTRNELERCIETAPTPPTEAACSAELSLVVAAQEFLALEQQGLIMKANAESLTGTAKLRSTLAGSSASVSPPTLQVDAKQKTELAPEYAARNNIEQAEKMNVNYQLTLTSVDSTVLRLLAYQGPKALRRSCAATITKRGSKYYGQMADGGRL